MGEPERRVKRFLAMTARAPAMAVASAAQAGCELEGTEGSGGIILTGGNGVNEGRKRRPCPLWTGGCGNRLKAGIAGRTGEAGKREGRIANRESEKTEQFI